MNVLFIVLSVVLTLLVISGWVMLLLAPVLILTTSTVGGLVKGAGHLQRSLPVFASEAMRGILCIDGLASQPSLARRLRFDIASVLSLAPAGTRPRACACVKESGDAFVGVLRVFNTSGHYLLRATGGTALAVADRFSAAMSDFKDTFPARVGARRIECPECDPRTCPLHGRKRQRAMAGMVV